jgi:hypothetical protein
MRSEIQQPIWKRNEWLFHFNLQNLRQSSLYYDDRVIQFLHGATGRGVGHGTYIYISCMRPQSQIRLYAKVLNSKIACQVSM